MLGMLKSKLSLCAILVISLLLGMILVFSPVVEWVLGNRVTTRFRYYSLPILVLICIVQPKTHPIIALTVSLFMNAVTQYLFFYRVFEWADGSVARFMWFRVC